MAKKRPKRQPKKLSIDVVEAQQIALVDEFGTKRASLSCSGGHGGGSSFVVIHLNDDQGSPKISLQVGSDGVPSICLFTPNNAPGVSMAVNPEGIGMSISDTEGKPCIQLGVAGPKTQDPRGPGPEICVHDEPRKAVWSYKEHADDILKKP